MYFFDSFPRQRAGKKDRLLSSEGMLEYTYITADNLVNVQSLYIWFELAKIPYQRAHAPWEGVYTVDEMT